MRFSETWGKFLLCCFGFTRVRGGCRELKFATGTGLKTGFSAVAVGRRYRIWFGQGRSQIMRPSDSPDQDAAAAPRQERAQYAHSALENLFEVSPDAIHANPSPPRYNVNQTVPW